MIDTGIADHAKQAVNRDLGHDIADFQIHWLKIIARCLYYTIIFIYCIVPEVFATDSILINGKHLMAGKTPVLQLFPWVRRGKMERLGIDILIILIQSDMIK